MKKFPVVAVVILAVFALFLVTDTDFSIIDYGFLTYDDFSAGVFDSSKWAKTCGSYGCNSARDVLFGSGDAVVRARSDLSGPSFVADVGFIAFQDFVGRDLRVSYVVDYDLNNVCSGTQNAGISISGCEGVRLDEGRGVIEVFSSRLDPSRFEVYVDGVLVCTSSFSNRYVGFHAYAKSVDNLMCSAELTIHEVLEKIPDARVVPPGYNVVFQQFYGPAMISLASLDRSLLGFPPELPMFIYDYDGGSVTTTTEVYDRLSKGEVVQVPLAQMYGVFYVGKMDSGDVACGVGEVFSLDGTCVSLTPFESYICPDEFTYDMVNERCVRYVESVSECTDGVYVPEEDICVVTPSTEVRCPSGFTYDDVADVCFKFAESELQCEIGTFDSASQKCVVVPPTDVRCPVGYEYDFSKEMCFIDGDIQDCPGEIIDNVCYVDVIEDQGGLATYVLVGVIAVLFVFVIVLLVRRR